MKSQGGGPAALRAVAGAVPAARWAEPGPSPPRWATTGAKGGLLNTEKLIMGGFFGTAGGRRVLGRLRRWAHTLIVMLGE